MLVTFAVATSTVSSRAREEHLRHTLSERGDADDDLLAFFYAVHFLGILHVNVPKKEEAAGKHQVQIS